MPIYCYKVSERSGKIYETEVEGDSPNDAVSRLTREGLLPIKLIGEMGVKKGGSRSLFNRKNRFNALDFTGRLAPLLEAHVQLARALSIIEEGMEEGEGKQVVSRLKRGLHEGKKFSSLIHEQGNAFPSIYSGLVASGEESGLLSETVKELHRFMVQRKEMKDFLISNSIYPIMVMVVTFGVILFLLFFVIPKFANTITQAGREMPVMIAVMISIADILAWFWWLWILLGGAITWLIVKIRAGGKWRERYDRWVLKIPVVSKYAQYAENSMFFRTLAILTQRNVHILPAVRASIDVIQNLQIKDSLSHLADDLKRGEKLSEALHHSPLIPTVATQLIRIGEESGRLGEMVGSVAEMSEGKLKDFIHKFLALFVPITILLLALIVGSVVVSIFIAIMQMNQ